MIFSDLVIQNSEPSWSRTVVWWLKNVNPERTITCHS